MKTPSTGSSGASVSSFFGLSWTPVTPDAPPSMRATVALLQCRTLGRASSACACASPAFGSLCVIQCTTEANLVRISA